MDLLETLGEKIPFPWIKRISVVTAGQILAQGAGFAFLVILAWFYSKDEYGYIRYVLGIGTFAGTVVSAGVPAALARYFAKNKDNKDLLNDYFSNGISINLFLMGCTSLILYLIYQDPMLILIMAGVSIVGIYQGMVRGLLLYGRIASFQLTVNLMKIAFLFVLVYVLGVRHTGGVLFIYGVTPILVIVIYSACFPLGLRFRPHRIRKQMVKEISIFSAWVTGSTLSHSALSTFNLIIIEVYRGYADVAVYSVAYTLMIPFTLSTTGLNIILYPKIAENPDPVRHRKLMHYAMAYSISVSLLLLGFYYLFGGWVIRTLFSEGYASAYPPLVILSTGALFINIRTSFSAYFEGSGKPYISTADSVTSAIIGILVSTLLVPHYGILGAAWGMTIGFLMACVVDLIGWIYREK